MSATRFSMTNNTESNNKHTDKNTYTRHEVAEILADAFGDTCACNLNCNDEWLPDHCELGDACPSPAGVACWEQYLKHLDKRDKEIVEEPKKAEPVVERELRVRYQTTQGAEDLYYCPETKRVYIRQPSNVPGMVFWLTASLWHGGYEASCPVKAGIAMVVMDRREEHELFREITVSDGGHDTFAEKKGEFYREAMNCLCSEIAGKYKLADHKKWRGWLLPDKDKMGYKSYDDNWLYCEDELIENETVESGLSVLGMKVYLRRFRYKHKISNKVWDSYIITSPSDKDGNICLGLCGYAIDLSKKPAKPAPEPVRDMLGYEVHDGDVVAVLCKEGFKGKYSTLRLGVVSGKRIVISEHVSPCYGSQSKLLTHSVFVKVKEGECRESCK